MKKQNTRFLSATLLCAASTAVVLSVASVITWSPLVHAATPYVYLYNTTTDNVADTECGFGGAVMKPPHFYGQGNEGDAYYNCIRWTVSNINEAVALELPVGGKCKSPNQGIINFGGNVGAFCVTGFKTGVTVRVAKADGSLPETPKNEEECEAVGGKWVREGAGGRAQYCEMPEDYSCTYSGGQWDSDKKKCYCPSGKRLVGNACVANDAKPYNPATDKSKNCSPDSGEKLSEDNCEIIKWLNTALNFVAGGVVLAVIGNIIFAGIRYSMAQGNPSATSAAKSRIQTAILALIMFALLYSFIEWLIPGGFF